MARRKSDPKNAKPCLIPECDQAAQSRKWGMCYPCAAWLGRISKMHPAQLERYLYRAKRTGSRINWRLTQRGGK